MMILKGMLSTIFLVMILSFSSGLCAQTNSDSTPENILFVKIDGLNPDGYAKVVKGIRASGLGDVGMACIPIELIRIDLKASSATDDEARSALATIIQETTGLVSVFQDEMQQAAFEEACSNARYGIQNN